MSHRYKMTVGLIKNLTEEEIDSLIKYLKFVKNTQLMTKTLCKFFEKNHPMECVFERSHTLNRYLKNAKASK